MESTLSSILKVMHFYKASSKAYSIILLGAIYYSQFQSEQTHLRQHANSPFLMQLSNQVNFNKLAEDVHHLYMKCQNASGTTKHVRL